MRVHVASVAFVFIASISVQTGQTTNALNIKPNDNRQAAGRLEGGVLTIGLEVRTGKWFPDGEDKPGVDVKAFATSGADLQVPGPMIRVPEGTRVHATISNTLQNEPLVMHGLYTRPALTDEAAAPLIIPPGESRDVTFSAGAPGTYFYWAASDPKATLNPRVGIDSQLAGGFIVDPRGGSTPDRVLILTEWNGLPPGGQRGTDNRFRFVINGRSWPNTERLTYAVGSTVRMRLIDASANVHPMHLHGFYFNVDSRGDERADHAFPTTASPHMVVTERLTPGSTFSLTWKPTRPGNWLFHCHDNIHVDYGGPLDRTGPRNQAQEHGEDHMDSMAGLVMGITVTGKSEEAADTAGRRRALRLMAQVDGGGTADEPAFGFLLDGSPHNAAAPLLPGSVLLLKRGEPVSVTVVNQLPEPTSVHWHGIELESYYDGVAGFGGNGQQVSPSIAPGGSFEARFTPPRSGTFIYHTHFDDMRQMRAGLSGPLIVMDDPSTFDPVHDIVFMVSAPRKQADNAKVYVNGTTEPPAREFQVGQHYRLRFINVHTSRPAMRMRILRGDQPLTWRAVAKDGRDLPADQSFVGPSEVQMGNGETYDFDFVPSEPGDIRLDVTSGVYALLTSLPIRVR